MRWVSACAGVAPEMALLVRYDHRMGSVTQGAASRATSLSRSIAAAPLPVARAAGNAAGL